MKHLFFIIIISLYKTFLFETILDENKILDYRKGINLCDLIITTDNYTILSNCLISESWRDNSDVMSSQIFEKTYEKSITKRRIFNIEYKDNSQETKTPILINKIEIKSINGNKYLVPELLSIDFPYLLEQGDSFDIIIEYNCIKRWDDIKIFLDITGEEKNIKSYFLYKKICETNYKNKPNFTYFFLCLSFLIIVLLSRHDFLIQRINFVEINIQEIIQAENAENILMTTSIILVIILFFIIIGYIKIISFVFSSLMSIITVESFLKSLFKIFVPNLTNRLEKQTFDIKILKLYNSNIITYTISILIYIFWFISENDKFYIQMIVNNFIVFIIIYFSIHKINWQTFYLVILIFVIIFIYQITFILYLEGIPIPNKSSVYNITTKLTFNIPIRFILPDFIKSPYEEIYFFSIVDCIMCGYILRYCENSEKKKKYSKYYFKIAKYALYLGILMNLFLFYVLRFAPPMHLIPSLLAIISVIIYSIIKKETWKFMDLEVQNDKQFIIFEQDNEEDNSFVSYINTSYLSEENSSIKDYKNSPENMIQDKINEKVLK